MDRRETWAVLSARAEGHVEAAARALARAQEAVDRTEMSRQRVQRLLQDCMHEQEAGHARALSLGDRRNASLFIAQLQAMAQGVQHSLQVAQAERDTARARLAQAQVDAHKAGHLLSQAERARRDTRSRQEQARLDEWTLLRHGHRSAGGDPRPPAASPPSDGADPLSNPNASPPR